MLSVELQHLIMELIDADAKTRSSASPHCFLQNACIIKKHKWLSSFLRVGHSSLQQMLATKEETV